MKLIQCWMNKELIIDNRVIMKKRELTIYDDNQNKDDLIKTNVDEIDIKLSSLLLLFDNNDSLILNYMNLFKS